MKEYKLVCTESMRVDKYVAGSGEINLSRSAAALLIDEGKVTVNGKTVNKKYKLSINDIIDVCIPDPRAI